MKIMQDFAPKDWATVSISAFALFLSIFATTWSTLQGRYEQQRLVRSQLSEVLTRIVSTDVDDMKLRHDLAKEPGYFQGISNALGYQHTFLLRQAMYLADQIPKLVTDIEYNTIAVGNASSGDVVNAEKYFKRSIDVAPNAVYESRAHGSYADFLFSMRRFEEARDQFRQALSSLAGNDNGARYSRGVAYQEWGTAELNLAHSLVRSHELFESARNEFNGIDVDPIKQGALASLQAAEGGNGTPGLPPPLDLQPGGAASRPPAPSR